MRADKLRQLYMSVTMKYICTHNYFHLHGYILVLCRKCINRKFIFTHIIIVGVENILV